MNLYDAYMTPRDRAACPAAEAMEVLARVLPIGGDEGGARCPDSPDGGCRNPDCGKDCERYPSLAMVYTPMQCFRNMYEPAEGLSRGTIFSELDKPLGKGGRR